MATIATTNADKAKSGHLLRTRLQKLIAICVRAAKKVLNRTARNFLARAFIVSRPPSFFLKRSGLFFAKTFSNSHSRKYTWRT